ASANPVMAIHECKVNEGKELNQQLWAPSIGRSTRPPALDPAEGQKTLDSLVGTWVSDWKSYGQVTTWVIAEDGTLTLTTVRDGKTETKALQITLEHEGRIKVQTTPTSTQDYSYFRAGPRLLYSANNLAYGIHRLADQKRFTLTIGSSWLVVEPGSCTAITERAETSAATCTWGKKDGVRTFTSDYEIPGRTRPDGKPMTQQNTYHLIAGSLLDERLVDIGTYKKK
ncbi:MAG TPA: hypothetical protein VML75_08500, partial [Kofleriaceae bacterium]|nr:hypothetical protein [Kofleriaceae bacterium]